MNRSMGETQNRGRSEFLSTVIDEVPVLTIFNVFSYTEPLQI